MTTTNLDARPRQHRADRHDRPADRRAGHSRAPARRAVEGRVRAAERVGQPGRPGRRGHGRLGDGRRAGACRAGRHGLAADPVARGPTACRRGRRRTRRSCARPTRGDTEETLAAYEAAGALGATRVVATSGGKLAELARADGVPVIPVAGGLQPRAAVAYITVAALEVAARCGAGPRCASDIDVAAEHLEELVVEWGPEAAEDSEAKALARGAASARSRSSTAPARRPRSPTAGRRSSTRTPRSRRSAHELPEADHNELVGWAGAAELGRFSAVFLEDCDTHPRIADRVELTDELIRDAAAGTFRVPTRGTTSVERVFSLVLLGDLVSVYHAALRGVDPGPVELHRAAQARSWPSASGRTAHGGRGRRATRATCARSSACRSCSSSWLLRRLFGARSSERFAPHRRRRHARRTAPPFVATPARRAAAEPRDDGDRAARRPRGARRGHGT